MALNPQNFKQQSKLRGTKESFISLCSKRIVMQRCSRSNLVKISLTLFSCCCQNFEKITFDGRPQAGSARENVLPHARWLSDGLFSGHLSDDLSVL